MKSFLVLSLKPGMQAYTDLLDFLNELHKTPPNQTTDDLDGSNNQTQRFVNNITNDNHSHQTANNTNGTASSSTTSTSTLRNLSKDAIEDYDFYENYLKDVPEDILYEWVQYHFLRINIYFASELVDKQVI